MIEERFAADCLGPVEEAVRRAAADEIMPRFRALTADQVAEKTGPHDLVTVADRGAEAHLAAALTGLLPGSVVVGEEGVAADPGLYAELAGDRPVWIVDPIDGTRTFVRGDEGFCTLVALAHHGELLASWTYAPARDEMATALRGGGARLNGVPLHAGPPAEGPPAEGSPVDGSPTGGSQAEDAPLEIAASYPYRTTPAVRRALLRLRTETLRTRPCAGSAGLEYLAIARGTLDATVFAWENAWDHAAGLLLVTEAGGAHATLTGTPFRLAGGNDLPFTTARDARTVGRIRSILLGDSPAP
ncbi:inositol monophosphatase family protein [Kitasatospora sp. NPDC057500]|uniref:inositol monophosphatase family protein n=1 Tax=Kitasatospora sp. NPDC057500 TaxID=3346151 RepID=UPI003675A71D